jgi:hypothetical protein
MKWLLATTCVAVLAASAAGGYRALKRAPQSAPVKSPSGELEETRRELEGLRAESASLRGAISGLQSAQLRRPDPAANTPGAPGRQAPASAPPAPPSSEEYAAYVESKYASERSDPAWDPRRELGPKITAVLPEGSSVRSLDCKTSMFRLETTHRSAAGYRDFTKSFVGLGGEPRPWNGPVVFQVTSEPTGDDVALTAVAYLGRESLPEFPQASAE